MDYGALIQMVMQLAGEMGSKADKEQSIKILQQAMDDFGNIDLPKLQQLVAEQLGPSAMEGVQGSIDPSLGAAETGALGAMDEIIQGEGLAGEDRAAINRIGNQVNRKARSGRDALAHSMAVRGTTGGGQDTAAQVAMSADANQQLNENGQNIQASALRRRIEAIRSKGAMAGSMRSARVGEAERLANARDAITRINAGYRATASAHNAGLPQQHFENALRRQSGKAGMAPGVSGAYSARGDDTRNAMAGYGAAIGRNLPKQEKQVSDERDTSYDLNDRNLPAWKDPNDEDDEWSPYPY